MWIDRYWLDDFGCPNNAKSGEVFLEDLLDACQYFYKKCGRAPVTPIADAWRLAKCTPTCIALCGFGADSGYVIVEEDEGLVWGVYTTSNRQGGEKVVHVTRVRKRDKEGLRGLLQRVAEASSLVRIIRINGNEAEVVREL